MAKDANYWNNKWKKAPIIYSGRALRTKDDRIGVDVKSFIKNNDVILEEIIKKYRLKKSSYDKTAHEIQKFVVKNLTYKYDDETAKVPEFWQFPFETLQGNVGDCEDGAILIAALCINAGIPSYKVKVAAGYVQASPTAPQGGHGYAIYLADDEEWRILDWCYAQDSNLNINKKPLAKDGGYKGWYKEIWFTFNDEYSWNQKELTINGRISENQSAKKQDHVKSSQQKLKIIVENFKK